MKNIFVLKFFLSVLITVLCLPTWADRYVVIKFEMPEKNKFMTYLFDSQGNRCWQVLDHLYDRYSGLCQGCKTVSNTCLVTLPKQYNGVFENKPITNPYMILKGLITKAIVYEGFGSNMFTSMCHLQKKQTQVSTCVFPDETVDKP